MINKIAKLLEERIPNKTWQPKVLAEEIYNLAIENLENQLYVARIMIRKANEKLADDEEIYNRLAELEDKIERGELVDVKENHLIAISRGSGKSSKMLKAIEILTKYENGTLIELPCKVGDDFYYITMIWDFSGKFIGEMYKAKVEGFYVSDGFIQIEDDEIFNYHAYGEEAFLTKAEAEAKLRELKELQDERLN